MIEKLYQLFLNSGCNVQTDTRLIKKGDVFFALRGERFDGNDFAQSALNIGASVVVVDRALNLNDDRVLNVENTLKTLQELALYHKQKSGVKVIGIAGSNGKTTTKELMSAVLSQQYNVYATPGNFNNHIGVPLTLLGIKPGVELAIVELGTNHPGEIEALCQIADPDFGMITNIGKEHLEGFGSLEAVAKEESFLFLYLMKNNRLAFVNACEEQVFHMAKRLEKKVVFGLSGAADSGYEFEVNKVVPQIEMIWKSEAGQFVVHSTLSGWHNAMNIASAVAVGLYFKVGKDNISKAIEGYVSKNKRSEWVQTAHNKVLLDAYNANPSSMMMALQTLDAFEGEKLAILGDMFELGQFAPEEHQAIVDFVESTSINFVLLLGKHFEQCQPGSKAVIFSSHEELNTFLKKTAVKNATILVKGSRGMEMEKVMESL
jgi:UDP-N-acetylmuramoyl-tripeptide--D-alanyl-D-alanine ligase